MFGRAPKKNFLIQWITSQLVEIEVIEYQCPMIHDVNIEEKTKGKIPVFSHIALL